MLLSEEIRSIIDGKDQRIPASRMVEELKEPVDEALELLNTHTNLTSLLQKKLDNLSTAFGVAKRVSKTGTKTPDDRIGVFEAFEVGPLASLKELRDIVDKSIKHVENVCRMGRYQKTMPTYGGSWTEDLDGGKSQTDGAGDLHENYAPAMGKIEPGMAIKLGGQVFRVIGKSGDSALIQPDVLRKQVYSPARGYPTPQSPVPSGTTVPQDAKTQPVQGNLSNPTGHTSLVGTSVLKYNPHSGMFQFCTGTMPGAYEMATTIQIVGHDPKMPNIAENMTVDKFELLVNEAEAGDIIEKLQDVAAGEVPRLVNDVFVDPFSAKAAIEMYEGFNDDGNRIKMGAMNTHELLRTTFSVMEKAKSFNSEE